MRCGIYTWNRETRIKGEAMRALFLVGFVILSASPTSADDAKQNNQYGTITGRFLLSGKIPQRQYAVKSGDQKLKNDCPKCAKTGILSDALLVDAKSKGIANVFIYLRKAPQIHPDLRKSRQKTKTVTFKNCRLFPHAMFVRTDQKIVVKNGGGVLHNVHPFPFRNPPIGALIAPLKNLNIRYQQVEPLPIPVRCDIHSPIGWFSITLTPPSPSLMGVSRFVTCPLACTRLLSGMRGPDMSSKNIR